MLNRLCLALAGLLLLVSAPSAQSPNFVFPSVAVAGRVLSVPAGTYQVGATYSWPYAARLGDNAKLVVPSGVTLTISGSLTFGANAAIEVQTGGTLTVQGSIRAEPTQHIFQGAGTVSIASTEALPEIYGEWFGVVSGFTGGSPAPRTYAAANSAAFTKAFASLTYGGTVRLLNGAYWLSCTAGDAITVSGTTQYAKSLVGMSRTGSIIYVDTNCTNYIIKVDQIADGASFRDFSIYGNQLADAATAVTVGGLWCTLCKQTTVANIRTFKLGNPFTLHSFSHSILKDIVAEQHSGTIRIGGGTLNDNRAQGAFAPRVFNVASLPTTGYGTSLVIDSGSADVEVQTFYGGSRAGRAVEITNTSTNGTPPELVRLAKMTLDASHEGSFHISWGRNVEINDSIIGGTIDPFSNHAEAQNNTNSPLTIDTGSKVVTSSITSGSAIVTPTSTVGLSPGMPVTGTGIPAGTRVSAVPMQVQLSAAATATASSAALNFGGSVHNASTTSGSTTVEISYTAVIAVGATVTGSGIPAGTTVASVTPATTVTLSANATATDAAAALTYEGPPEQIDAFRIMNSQIRGGGGSGVKIVKGCNVRVTDNTLYVNSVNTTALSGGVEVGSACGLVEISGNMSGITKGTVSGGNTLYANVGGSQDYGLVIGTGASAATYTNTWGAPGGTPAARTFVPRIFISNNMLQGNVSGSILDNSTGWTAGCGTGANKCIQNNMVD